MIFECTEVSTLDENRIGYRVYTDNETFAENFKSLPLCPFLDNSAAGWTHVVKEVSEPGDEIHLPGRKDWVHAQIKEAMTQQKESPKKKAKKPAGK